MKWQWIIAGFVLAAGLAMATADRTFGPGWIVGGRRKQKTVDYRLVSYLDPGGLDLRPARKYSARGATPVQFIVVHWGSNNARDLHGYFASATDAKSTHVGVDATGVYQYLDLDVRAWHAADANKYSVGLDIAQSPSVTRLDSYRRSGLHVEPILNPTPRGDRNVLSLDDRTRENTAKAIVDLLDVLGLPLKVPTTFETIGTKAIREQGWTVVGHFHVSAGKWDPAPWWIDLLEEIRKVRR